jgi:hypothetical protein
MKDYAVMLGIKVVVLGALFLAVGMTTGCSTTAGMVKGIGEDVKSATDWTASKIKP